MNELHIFNSEEFGDIRTAEIDGKPYFVGTDVAKALGYSNPRKAILDHCKGVTKRDTPTTSGVQSMSYINEGDLYRLIMKSKLPSAEKFEAWVMDEVLPTIRKTGSYQKPMTTAEQIQLLAQGTVELNQRVDTLGKKLERLEYDLPVLPVEADRITEAVKKKGTAVLGGKLSNAYKSRSIRQKVYSNIHSNLRYQFQVKSYKSIKRNQVDKAVDIIGRYEPPVFLQNEIDSENAQETMF